MSTVLYRFRRPAQAILMLPASDYFGTGKLKTHDEGFVVKHRSSQNAMLPS